MGKCFLKQLPNILESHTNVLLIAISSSKKVLHPRFIEGKSSLSLKTWEADLEACKLGDKPTDVLRDWLTPIRKYSPSQVVLIDITSSEDVASMYPRLISRGVSIVTANKKAFSSSSMFWKHLMDLRHHPMESGIVPGLLYHEASVGAGLPVLCTLKDLIATGDDIKKIEGVFSGTMSFLFNNFAPTEGEGGRWSEEVKKAKDLGYTEPDPRDDLNGMDVARKAIILARVAGMEVQDTSSFPVESLIPNALVSATSSDEFMAQLPKHDDEMEKVKEAAAKEGKVVRFVGSVDVSSGKLKVGLENYDKGHPIASLKGSDNIFVFYTKRYGKNPLVIQGAGYGVSLLLSHDMYTLLIE